ncbi:MAG TPA: CAP domain-containing protein [Candidatus Sulfotelmatobacter sp.]|nr:CAP domain-containing protein [Candidatus Sulfotelmatobacter sp.]
MRFLTWLGGFAIVAALGGAGISVVHREAIGQPVLTASRAQLAQPSVGTDFAKTVQHAMPRKIKTPPPPPPPAPPAASTGGSGPAAPAIVVNSTQQALINRDRAANGLGPLTWNGCLYSVAQANARRIAAQGYLSHTNGPSVDLTCGLGHQAGENIGYWSAGVNDTQLNTMFMNSPDHRANIMGPYRYVATAWVVASNGYGYVAVEFS